MKMLRNIILGLAVLLIIVSFNIHAAETATPAAQATAQDQEADKKKDSNKKGNTNNNSDPSKAWFPPEPLFIYGVIGIIFCASLISFALIRSALSHSKFSLADVLSEEANITSPGADGKPVTITELRGSSSRVIAFVGMVVILMMFMGFGIFSLYAFAKNGEMPDSQNIAYFLLGGSMLFAPYGANQFSALFEKLTPKKT
jgi:hypothetical protein